MLKLRPLFAAAVLTITAPLALAQGSGLKAPGARADGPMLSYYFGQGSNTNLPDLPGRILRGNLRLESSYFNALGYTHPLGTPNWFASVGMPNATTGIDLVLAKHHGMQDNWEVAAAYMIRSPYAELGPVRLRAGAGMGLSYAAGYTAYEDGTAAEPDKRYRLLQYTALEVEGRLQQFPRTGLVLRVHHRSGIYGLIAPRTVGSNFITLGLRYEF